MVRSDINGVMWSMTVECLASPLILLCFGVHQRLGPPPLIALCLVLFAISFWGPYAHLLGGFTNLAPLYAFVIGVLLHFGSQRRHQPRFYALAVALALTVLLLCGLRKQTAPTILGESIGAAALIYLIAIDQKNRLFAVLDTAPARFAGAISYSFYLLHRSAFLWELDRARDPHSPLLCWPLATPLRWPGYFGD
ncbi:peptidoglycan/LPS O-acetylase OafA/YrhL [Bradyrhizobium sp. F1.4.3]